MDQIFKLETKDDDELIFFLSGVIMAGIFLHKFEFRQHLFPFQWPIVLITIGSLIVFYATFVALKGLRKYKVL